MRPDQYRLNFFLTLFYKLAPPILALSTALAFSGRKLGHWAVPAHTAFFIVWTAGKIAITQFREDREIAKLGARPIPRVVGKWPGNIDILVKMVKDLETGYSFNVYHSFFEEYQSTTLNLRLLWSDTIITTDQEHIKFLLTSGFHSFYRGPGLTDKLETFLGKGILNSDDEMWKMHRIAALPFFDQVRIPDFELLERDWTRLLAHLSASEAAGEPAEAQEIYGRLSIDVCSEILFGKNLNTLAGDLPKTIGFGAKSSESSSQHDGVSFMRAFEKLQSISFDRVTSGNLYALAEMFGDKMKPHVKVLHEWLEPLVKRAQQSKTNPRKTGSFTASKSFVEHLAESYEDSTLIRDQALTTLLSFREPIKSTMTYVTYFMAMYPEVTARLRAEVLKHCGPNDPPTPEQIDQMRYLRAVIDETLRLYPPVPIGRRECRSAPSLFPSPDSTYPNSDPRPLYVPGNAEIPYFSILAYRNKTLWGSDADEFNPDRWLQPEWVDKHTDMFIPFSIGPRTCIGQNFAYREISYFLVRLLQQFERFTLAPEYQPKGSLPPADWKNGKGRQAMEKVWPVSTMTLSVKGGLWVRFHKARS